LPSVGKQANGEPRARIVIRGLDADLTPNDKDTDKPSVLGRGIASRRATHQRLEFHFNNAKPTIRTIPSNNQVIVDISAFSFWE
jgi:hypothetical protein